MAIELTTNFSEQASLPLDDRFSFIDIAARNALASGRRYEGMLVYVQATKLIYKLDSDLTTWVEFGTGTGTFSLTAELENKIKNGILAKVFNRTGDLLTSIDYKDTDGGTTVYTKVFNHTGDVLTSTVITRISDSATETATFTHVSGVLTKKVWS